MSNQIQYACPQCEASMIQTRHADRDGAAVFAHEDPSTCAGVYALRILGWTIRRRPVFPTIPANVFRYEVHPACGDRLGGPGRDLPIDIGLTSFRQPRPVRAH